MNERLETLVGMYAAAVKVYINDACMLWQCVVRLRYSKSQPAAF